MILPEETAHGAPEFGIEQVKEQAYAEYDCGCKFQAPANQKCWPDWIGKDGQDIEVTPETEGLHKLECPHKIGYLKSLKIISTFKKVVK